MAYRVAVLGATGLVGRTMLAVLEEREFPVTEVRPLASGRSAGRKVPFAGEELAVEEAVPEAFTGIDLVLSSAGGAVSKELLPEAARREAVSIDNTSAFRMEPDVPLIVPEVNAHRIPDYGEKRILANPNCSTIQMVVALKPLHDAFGIRRVIVATYQGVSGAGQKAVEELAGEIRATSDGKTYERRVFPHPIAFNALPHIDVFLATGETREEWKMRVETPKIMEAEIPVHATCVRVPVYFGHSEAVWVETERPITPAAARQVWAAAPGLEVMDDPTTLSYPTAAETAGMDPVYVGRIRQDPTADHGLAFWCVSDNIRKGAALNAVQIAEGLVRHWQEHGR